MTAVAWIISFAAFLGGIAVWADDPFASAHVIAAGLLSVSMLSCPFFWENDAVRALFPGRQRGMAVLAMLLALPLVLLPA